MGAAQRFGRGLRDAWLVVGATVVLVLALEVAYRAQGAARRALFSGPDTPAELVPPSPFDTVPWAEAYTADHLREESLVWTPYVYFRNPTFTGTEMSVDSAGHRVTPHPEGPAGDSDLEAAADTIDVYFLGGSTTFGWFQRDAHTIPAVAARELQASLPSGVRLRVTNFGVPGRTFTQEVIDLLLALQAGERPDVVVFYDGINDVMATVQNGAAGIPQNESNRVADFERGRRVTAEAERGFGNDLRLLGRSVWAVAQRLELVQRVAGARAPETPEPISADSASASLASVYRENVGIVDALADRYGFTAIYVWQPALMSTGKTLTEREAWLLGPAERDPQITRIRDVHRTVPALLAETVPAMVGDRFVDATGVFDDDPEEVFSDLFGHTYERANPAVVRSFLPALTRAVAGAGQRATSGASSDVTAAASR